MTARELAALVPLAFGVGVVLLCAAGLLATRGAYDRLHVIGPAALLGPSAVAVALAVASGTSQLVVKAVLIAAVSVATGPVVTHATARAARLRARGDLKVSPDDEGGKA